MPFRQPHRPASLVAAEETTRAIDAAIDVSRRSRAELRSRQERRRRIRRLLGGTGAFGLAALVLAMAFSEPSQRPQWLTHHAGLLCTAGAMVALFVFVATLSERIPPERGLKGPPYYGD